MECNERLYFLCSEILDYSLDETDNEGVQKYPVPLFDPETNFDKMWKVKKADLPDSVWM